MPDRDRRANRTDALRLTRAPPPRTIARMQRDTLRSILERVDGLARTGDDFRCRDGHEVTLYLGELGRAMVVPHIQSVTLQAAHIEVIARDRGRLLVPVEAVQGVQDVEAEHKGVKRSGVGFNG